MPHVDRAHASPLRRRRTSRRLPALAVALPSVLAAVAFASPASAASPASPASPAVVTSAAAVTSTSSVSVTASSDSDDVTVPTPEITVRPTSTTATVEWTFPGDVRWLSDVRIVVRDGQTVVADLTQDVRTAGYGASGRTEVDDLLSGHDYEVSVTAGSDGIDGAPATTTFTTLAYEVEEIGAASVRAGAGVSVPFAVRLQRPPRTAVDVTVTVDPAWLFTIPEVTVRVPAGALSATGSIPLAGDVDEPTAARFSLPDEPDRYFNIFRVFPSTGAPLPQVTLSLPSSVTESDATQAVPVTATLDRPLDHVLRVDWSSSVDDGYGLLDGDVTFPAGATTAQFAVRLPGDDDTNPGRYLRLIMGAFYNTDPSDDVTVPQLPYVPIVDDDGPATPPAHALSLEQDSMSGRFMETGRATRITVTWRNEGTVTASDVHVTGRVSQPGAVLRVTAAGGTCPTRRLTNGVSYDCPVGTLDPGEVGEALVDVSPVSAATGVRATAAVADGVGTKAAAEPITFTIEGPTCTITGDMVGGDTLTGTRGADVLCGPARTFGRADLVVRPGAGNDYVLATGTIDYSDSPRPLKVVTKPNALRITGWGNDILPDVGYGAVLRTLRASGYADALELRSGLSLQAGPGDDTITDPGYVHGGLGGTIRIDGGTGVDTLVITKSYQGVELDLGGQTGLSGVENLVTGRFGDTVRGSDEANRISTGEGNDTIDVSDGIGGNDVVDAGGGEDTCVADVGDTVTRCEKVTWVPVPAS